jgi:hypothetical protein
LYRTSPTPETAHTGKNQTEDPVLRQRKALFSSLLEALFPICALDCQGKKSA